MNLNCTFGPDDVTENARTPAHLIGLLRDCNASGPVQTPQQKHYGAKTIALLWSQSRSTPFPSIAVMSHASGKPSCRQRGVCHAHVGRPSPTWGQKRKPSMCRISAASSAQPRWQGSHPVRKSRYLLALASLHLLLLPAAREQRGQGRVVVPIQIRDARDLERRPVRQGTANQGHSASPRADYKKFLGRLLQQAPVVRHEDDAALELLQRFGQRIDGVDVEVIRRLVQQEQMWLLCTDLSEKHADTLATR
mmetsp:Transcript_43067/g.123171  ORF Transcript_43067/g.123171 Transcript_43067/m.123171 type:complete len:250 (-) Transcript_43067:866-1615(-)